MIRIVLAVNEPRLADHLSGLAAESEELELVAMLRDPQELRGSLPRHDADAVILHDRTGHLSLFEIAREVTITQPELGLVLVVEADSPDMARSGMLAGARDVIAEPVGLDQLESSAAAAAGWTQTVRRRTARDRDGEPVGIGRVVTVVGAKGGVGTTTVAAHLALAACELGKASVCLVEYDLQAGDLRSFLDLPYRRSVVDLVAVAEELNNRALQESLYTHPSGLRVLLGPQEGEQAEEVRAAAARNVLTAIRTREDLTVVDAGSTLTDASAIAVEMADTVLIVSTPDVISLRGVVRLCGLWDRLKINPSETAVLLNRTSRKLEVQPDLARRVVPVPLLETTVAADFFALEAAANTGIPGSDAASDAMLRPMAAVLGEISALPAREPEGRQARPRSIAARFAGESGQATVETMATLPLILLVLVGIWQIAMVGATFVFSGQAARSGARALAVGSPIVSAARQGVPSVWRDGMTVHADPPETGRNQGLQTVHVSVPVPEIPGLLSIGSISSSDTTVIEDQLVSGESEPWTLVTGPIATTGPAVTGTALLAGLKIVPGNTAVIEPDGDAAAPANAPLAVKEMIAAANEIVNTSYLYGGCHGTPLASLCSAYDCSSATSFVLWAAGQFPSSEAEGSIQLEGYGDPSPGNWVTVYGSTQHAYIVIAGIAFDTADYGGPNIPAGTGPRWRNSTSQNATEDGQTTWQARHPAGL
jgi:pilus assembly protein CpaE